jgi:uncharacterized protein YbjQ (UPF0145 family)
LSPLFRRGPRIDPADAQDQARRDQESLDRLSQGHIPLAAAERLATLAARPDGTRGPFASDLSVHEFSLLHRLGIVPITLVMGSSIYQVGWQMTYFNHPTEIDTLSGAYNESRRLALARLLEETTLAGADAVVGVRIEQGAHDWSQGSVEFVAVGTAVRLPDSLKSPSGPVLSDLDGQEFWRLCAGGFRPVGIAAHTSVHYVPATWQTAQAMRGGLFTGASSYYNQELTDFTQGVYDAREKAMGYVTDQARSLGADGIVGVRIDEHFGTRRVNRGGIECEDLIVTFHVIGTAIRADPQLAATATENQQQPPSMTISLARKEPVNGL